MKALRSPTRYRIAHGPVGLRRAFGKSKVYVTRSSPHQPGELQRASLQQSANIRFSAFFSSSIPVRANPNARRAKKRWSDRDLQVFDLKAAVSLSSAWVIEAGRTGSRRIMLAVPCMHHAPSRGHRRRLRGGRQTDMNPSNPRVATLSDVARHRTRCISTA